jgi:DNA topoisomerase VI subunit B
MTATLDRTTFTTSRLLDFCNRKELIAQTGHQPDSWPLVLLKELIDNGIDACEDKGTPPAVTVTVDAQGITVADNGPGIDPETVARVLDFSVRVSSREAYVAPDRGKQGNALKTVVAMPFVLDGDEGRVEIAARGVRHAIALRVDKIRQTPVIAHDPHPDASVSGGTTARVFWPHSSCSTLERCKARFLQIADDYTFLNPHLSLAVSWFGEESRTYPTVAKWPKWRPCDPTSAHWYAPEHFERLAAGYIAHDQDRGEDRTVREFVAQFDGFSGSAKQGAVLAEVGLKRVRLSELANEGGVKADVLGRLLEAMKRQARPVKPARLGVIGKSHIAERFKALGCEMESFDYRKVTGETDSLPWVIETAFAWRPAAKARRFITGVNWSPGILNPFRELGRFGQSLDSILEQQRAGRDEPVVLLLHIACPRVEYTDRGKSAVVIPNSPRYMPEDDENAEGEEE